MKIIIITGQTATGKTAYALKLAQKYNGELINYDSRQIYKYLNIITGKDFTSSNFQEVARRDTFCIGYYTIQMSENAGQKSVSTNQSDISQQTPDTRRIWLYDILDPKHSFSSYDYQQCALYVIKKLLAEGKTPIIVGGTYLYLRHLLYTIETENILPNWELRKQLEHKTVPELQTMLAKEAPQLFIQLNQSERNNPQRLIRKIEIATSTTIQTWRRENSPSIIKLPQKLHIKNLSVQIIGRRFLQKELLIETITNRVEERLKKGAVEEVKNLLSQGYTENDYGLKTIGYKQIINYLKGELSKEKAISQWITKEVQYAKRQYTFMKKDLHITWIEA